MLKVKLPIYLKIFSHVRVSISPNFENRDLQERLTCENIFMSSIEFFRQFYFQNNVLCRQSLFGVEIRLFLQDLKFPGIFCFSDLRPIKDAKNFPKTV
jgi:hypothetical protein